MVAVAKEVFASPEIEGLEYWSHVDEQYPKIIEMKPAQNYEFNHLVERYQDEIVLHCYRMMGSVDEAEDLAQETFIRAWKQYDSFEGRSTERTWLYRIATNACIDVLRKHKRRRIYLEEVTPLMNKLPELTAAEDVQWMEPFPDAMLPDMSPNPETVMTQRESVNLAFMIALQELPPKQRATLILRDVLNWRAKEVADLLDMTELAAHSALNRARKTLEKTRDRHGHRPDMSHCPELLKRYVAAWQNADVDGLVALVREDVIMAMPPLSAWYDGLAACRAFMEIGPFAGREAWRLEPIGVNGQPGFLMYNRYTHEDDYQLFCINVLTIVDREITRIDYFITDNRGLRVPDNSGWLGRFKSPASH